MNIIRSREKAGMVKVTVAGFQEEFVYPIGRFASKEALIREISKKVELQDRRMDRLQARAERLRGELNARN